MGDGCIFHFMKTMQRSHTHQTDQVLVGTQTAGYGWQMGCDLVGPFWESYLTISCQVEDALLPLLWRTCLLHVRKNVRGSAACNYKRLQVTCAPLRVGMGQSHSRLRAATICLSFTRPRGGLRHVGDQKESCRWMSTA